MTAQPVSSPSLWPAAHIQDARRPRSQQRQLGASDTVCERRAAYILSGAERTDTSDKRAAILGTYLHEGLLGSARSEYGWLVETAVADDSIRGHVDAVHLDASTAARLPKRLRPTTPADVVTVEDIKTKSTFLWDRVIRYGATEAEIRQAYLYADLLRTVGWLDIHGQKPMARLGPIDVRRIRFRFVNRDNGAEYVQEFPFDKAEATRARWWVQRVMEYESPEEATRSFDGPGLDPICDNCPFRTPCWGEPKTPGAAVQTVLVHDDADRETALSEYVRGHEMEAEGQRVKKKARAKLDDSPAGIYGPNQLRWTGGNPVQEVDREAMIDTFDVLGVPIPEKTGADFQRMEAVMKEAGVAIPMRTAAKKTTRAIRVTAVQR
ncbi:hypothetical protein [Streptomyces sp. NBC_01233]|uniref:hypothetical protein n=1 Tax=Streptomyces sp. NBC_01233 TaxID=2903787 RepID=UPI002E13BEA8|nr:hypothetical protein OG332_14350 [Streptomyces sp. NBC_01233]